MRCGPSCTSTSSQPVNPVQPFQANKPLPPATAATRHRFLAAAVSICRRALPVLRLSAGMPLAVGTAFRRALPGTPFGITTSELAGSDTSHFSAPIGGDLRYETIHNFACKLEPSRCPCQLPAAPMHMHSVPPFTVLFRASLLFEHDISVLLAQLRGSTPRAQRSTCGHRQNTTRRAPCATCTPCSTWLRSAHSRRWITRCTA